MDELHNGCKLGTACSVCIGEIGPLLIIVLALKPFDVPSYVSGLPKSFNAISLAKSWNTSPR